MPNRVSNSGDYMYIIGVGDKEDWDAGHGSIYFIEDNKGECAIPVFTTLEKLNKYFRANLNTVEAHMSMLESAGLSHARPLTEKRFTIMPLDDAGVEKAAAMADADYLIRDPRPGYEQEIRRLPK